jgi:hypothetical protein
MTSSLLRKPSWAVTSCVPMLSCAHNAALESALEACTLFPKTSQYQKVVMVNDDNG